MLTFLVNFCVIIKYESNFDGKNSFKDLFSAEKIFPDYLLTNLVVLFILNRFVTI